jgi:hypothetical protein
MWNAFGGESDMKGMDMMAARIVMPMGTEQSHVLTAVANEGQDMSFAKSFGEIAADAVETASAGQMLKGTIAPIARGAEAPAGAVEKLLYISVADGSKETSAPVSTALAKNNNAAVVGTKPASAQSSEKLGNLLQAGSVVAGNKTAEIATLQSTGGDVSGRVTPVSIEKPIGRAGDVVANQEAEGKKIDSVLLPFISKVAEPLGADDADQPSVQKKEVATVSTGKLIVEKTTTKAELKDKSNSSVAADDAKNVSLPVEVSGMQVPLTGSAGEANTLSTDTTADKVANAGTAPGYVIGIAGTKMAKSSPYGADPGVVGKSASGASKDGTVAAAKADAGTKKDEADGSKTGTAVVSANGLNEGMAHGFGAGVAAMATHGVLAVTGDVVCGAVAVKASANANGVATAAGQDGTNQAASSVSEGHRTLEATPTSLEVGVANGTQGWLKIRAEIADGGVVNASVSATTSAGQEMLHRELPSLTAYLQQEQIGVGSVVLHTTATTGSQEFGGGMERDAERGQMQRGGQEGESQQDARGTTFSDNGEAYVQGGLSGIAEITTNSVYTGGSWLSVRA